MTLNLFALIQSCYMPSYMILGSTVPQLHVMRMVCLVKAVTSSWVSNTVLITLVIDYTRYCDSLEILQAKVKCLLLIEPARPVPRALNKHYSARPSPINVTFIDDLHNIQGLFT